MIVVAGNVIMRVVMTVIVAVMVIMATGTIMTITMMCRATMRISGRSASARPMPSARKGWNCSWSV